MVEELDGGYVCLYCGRSVLDEDKEAKHYPFHSESCRDEWHIEVMEEYFDE